MSDWTHQNIKPGFCLIDISATRWQLSRHPHQLVAELLMVLDKSIRETGIGGIGGTSIGPHYIDLPGIQRDSINIYFQAFNIGLKMIWDHGQWIYDYCPFGNKTWCCS